MFCRRPWCDTVYVPFGFPSSFLSHRYLFLSSIRDLLRSIVDPIASSSTPPSLFPSIGWVDLRHVVAVEVDLPTHTPRKRERESFFSDGMDRRHPRPPFVFSLHGNQPHAIRGSTPRPQGEVQEDHRCKRWMCKKKERKKKHASHDKHPGWCGPGQEQRIRGSEDGRLVDEKKKNPISGCAGQGIRSKQMRLETDAIKQRVGRQCRSSVRAENRSQKTFIGTKAAGSNHTPSGEDQQKQNVNGCTISTAPIVEKQSNPANMQAILGRIVQQQCAECIPAVQTNSL